MDLGWTDLSLLPSWWSELYLGVVVVVVEAATMHHTSGGHELLMHQSAVAYPCLTRAVRACLLACAACSGPLTDWTATNRATTKCMSCSQAGPETALTTKAANADLWKTQRIRHRPSMSDASTAAWDSLAEAVVVGMDLDWAVEAAHTHTHTDHRACQLADMLQCSVEPRTECNIPNAHAAAGLILLAAADASSRGSTSHSTNQSSSACWCRQPHASPLVAKHTSMLSA